MRDRNSKKLKVLFVGSFAGKNKIEVIGGQRYACNTIIESNLSNDIDWIKLDSTGESKTVTPFWKRLLKATKRFFQFLFFLVTKKLDVVLIFSSNGFSMLEKGAMALLAKFFRKKVIISPRAGPLVNDLKKPFFRKFIVFVFKQVDYVICQSNSWQQCFIELDAQFNENKFVVIKNWINVSNYFPNPHRWSQDKKVFTILYLAWIEKAKGIYDLIDAVARIVKKNKHVKVIIAGDGKEIPGIKNKVKEYNIEDNVEISGWVTGKQKAQLLQDSDLFVLPSYYEGSPNALKEAMASGIPSIASKVGAIPEIIQDQYNGLMYTAGNVDELAAKLQLLISNTHLRKTISENGIYTISKEHDIVIAIDKLKKILL